MCLKKLLESLPVTENADKKISTKGFFIFAGIMIIVIIGLVILLSIF